VCCGIAANLIEEGSKLLRLAMFPVAKKEKKTRKKNRRTASTSSLLSSSATKSPVSRKIKPNIYLLKFENFEKNKL
jgi:hypothetical protein